MEIRILRYFSVIAQQESFSRAADILHISQPALSHQIQQLEESLHTQLFDRKNRRITLTEDGRKLQKRAQDILRLVDKTENEFLCPENELSGDVYISSGEAAAFRPIANVIAAMYKDYPSVRFHLYSRTASKALEQMENGLLDFAAVIVTSNIQKYNRIDLPSADSWGLLMRKDSPLAQKDVVTIEDLSDIPLICSRNFLRRNDLSGWLGREINELKIVATFDMIYNASFLVQNGMGYALTYTEITNYNSDLLCTRPLYPSVPVHMALIWRKHIPLSNAAKKFIDYLQKEIERE